MLPEHVSFHHRVQFINVCSARRGRGYKTFYAISLNKSWSVFLFLLLFLPSLFFPLSSCAPSAWCFVSNLKKGELSVLRCECGILCVRTCLCTSPSYHLPHYLTWWMERAPLNNAEPQTPGTLQQALSNGHVGSRTLRDTRSPVWVCLQSSPQIRFLVPSSPTCHLAARRMSWAFLGSHVWIAWEEIFVWLCYESGYRGILTLNVNYFSFFSLFFLTTNAAVKILFPLTTSWQELLLRFCCRADQYRSGLHRLAVCLMWDSTVNTGKLFSSFYRWKHLRGH